MSKHGRCLCGAVTFTYDGGENWCAHCHCDSCRRQTSSPFTTFVSVPDERFAWTAGEPAVFTSSPGVRRLFCRDCGTPLSYDSGEPGLALAHGAFDRAGAIPIGWQSDTYARHPDLGPLPMRESHIEDSGPNPANRQHPDHDT